MGIDSPRTSDRPDDGYKSASDLDGYLGPSSRGADYRGPGSNYVRSDRPIDAPYSNPIDAPQEPFPQPNSSGGYALALAVGNGFKLTSSLVDQLLKQESVHADYAIHIAVKRGDITLDDNQILELASHDNPEAIAAIDHIKMTTVLTSAQEQAIKERDSSILDPLAADAVAVDTGLNLVLPELNFGPAPS